ncbi:rhodanese-like domain-containing protein [uncultured Aquitalea sp.]|uniref:rhodanese-like domain-containing protein n=1 Tax=uncultured Aquitalea sp. TaxID=540272 RepID=UPI0025CECE9B|nr:rhodanese-like domain-containing protein [uncultured Aquitalea sp.]
MQHLFGALLGGVTAARFAQNLNSPSVGRGKVLLDVGSPEQFQQDHLPGARPLPLALLVEQVEMLIPDKALPLMVYCRTGAAASEATATLRRMGYQQVECLGGMAEAAGRLPVML